MGDEADKRQWAYAVDRMMEAELMLGGDPEKREKIIYETYKYKVENGLPVDYNPHSPSIVIGPAPVWEEIILAETITGVSDGDDRMSGIALRNTYVFHYNWCHDIITYDSKAYHNGLIFYGNSPETFKVIKRGDDLKIQRDDKGHHTITIKRFNPDLFFFYSGTNYGSTKRIWDLVPNGDDQYKFALNAFSVK